MGCSRCYAAVEASVYLCEPGEAIAEANVTAKAIATAWAKVITVLDGECTSTGHASACSLGLSSIQALAKLEAHAMAEAWAAVESDCNCTVEVEAAAEAIESALVTATLDVFALICVKGAHLQEQVCAATACRKLEHLHWLDGACVSSAGGVRSV